MNNDLKKQADIVKENLIYHLMGKLVDEDKK
jgi:hypothetical protein